MVLPLAAVFRAPVSQNPQQGNIMFLEKGNHSIVEQIRSYQSILAVVKFGKTHLGIGVDKGLLVNATNTFERANIEGVLRAQVSGMLGFDLTVSFLVLFGSFQSDDLPLGEDQAILSHLCFQGFQAKLEGLQVVT